MRPSIVIVGAGPNLGAAIARRFGREGLAVGLVARDAAKLDMLAGDLAGLGITAAYAAADIRDASALSAAITSLSDRLGPVEVLEYSPLPAREFMKPILETTVEDVRGPLEFSVLGAVAAATAVVGPMLERGSGTILFTTGGAAINPNAARTGVGISFAGEVAYARMLHDELAGRGVHVAHTAVGGAIGPGLDHEPDDVPTCCGATTPSGPGSRSGSASTEGRARMTRLGSLLALAVQRPSTATRRHGTSSPCRLTGAEEGQQLLRAPLL